jgi:hypothetical protein
VLYCQVFKGFILKDELNILLGAFGRLADDSYRSEEILQFVLRYPLDSYMRISYGLRAVVFIPWSKDR